MYYNTARFNDKKYLWYFLSLFSYNLTLQSQRTYLSTILGTSSEVSNSWTHWRTCLIDWYIHKGRLELSFPQNIRVIRTHLRINVTESLPMGFVLRLDNGDWTWVQCRYEKIFGLYFACGRIEDIDNKSDWQIHKSQHQ